jgi:flagellin-like protein
MTQQKLQTENRLIGKRLKGISPLIATLILIAITIVGGILVYHVFFSTASSISSNGNIQKRALTFILGQT